MKKSKRPLPPPIDQLKTAIKVLKFYEKMVDDFPEEALGDDQQVSEWSLGFMHVLNLLQSKEGPETRLNDYLEEWKLANKP